MRRFAAQAGAPDPRRDALREQVLRVVPRIAAEVGATRVWLFGSLAWGGFHDRSDVDLAVEGLAPGERDAFGGRALMAIDAPVDVVLFETAPEGLRDRIRREGELIWEAAGAPDAGGAQ